MVTITTAQNALKDLYLDVVSEQLNTKTNVLLNQFKKTTNDVYGREVQRLVPYGVNGGVGAGDEGGLLPSSEGNPYLTFSSSLKNLYGTIEISDKAMKSSVDDAGAFVNLLTAEMEGLLTASKFNLGRMIYGDGSGLLANVVSAVKGSGKIVVSSTKNLIEGLVVDFYNGSNLVLGGARIVLIDHPNNAIYTDQALTTTFATTASNLTVYVQNSKGEELTGLENIFAQSGSIYGVDKSNYPFLISYLKTMGQNETFDESLLQAVLDEVEMRSGNKINFIVTTNAVKRKFASVLRTYTKNIESLEITGGYKALSFNGIPLYGDKFVPNGTLYALNTNDFAIHELCDWEWLANEDGSILKQKQGYASFVATLVKYAELMCSKPGAQGKISGIN
ncbi:MAG: phage major capsid protein [Clostridia bacterium]|nr:phage major capsid protein [Clostridia bacterium]